MGREGTSGPEWTEFAHACRHPDRVVALAVRRGELVREAEGLRAVLEAARDDPVRYRLRVVEFEIEVLDERIRETRGPIE